MGTRNHFLGIGNHFRGMKNDFSGMRNHFSGMKNHFSGMRKTNINALPAGVYNIVLIQNDKREMIKLVKK